MTALADAMICRPIPLDDRRRAWVQGWGHGTEIDRVTMGSTVTQIGVRLDTGVDVTAVPAQVHEAGPADFRNVVPLLRPPVLT
jgi:hypothetical protein